MTDDCELRSREAGDRRAWALALVLIGVMIGCGSEPADDTGGVDGSADAGAAGIGGFGAYAGTSSAGGAAGVSAGMGGASGASPGGASSGGASSGGTSSGGAAAVAQVVTDDVENPYGVALDDDYVYWTDRGRSNVARCPLAGCTGAPEVLASDIGQLASGIAVDATAVYFVSLDAVWKVSKDGSNLDTLSSGESGAIWIAVDSEYVFWTSINTGALRRCEVGGCGGVPTTLATVTKGYRVRLRPNHVYWTNEGGGGRVLSCLKEGCGTSPNIVVPGSFGVGLAVDSSGVYFSEVGSQALSRCPLAGCTTPEVLADSNTSPYHLIVDGPDVYFTDLVGYVFHTPSYGYHLPDLLFTGDTPTDIAVDASAVYWTDLGSSFGQGSVMRMAR